MLRAGQMGVKTCAAVEISHFVRTWSNTVEQRKDPEATLGV